MSEQRDDRCTYVALVDYDRRNERAGADLSGLLLPLPRRGGLLRQPAALPDGAER